MCMRYITVKPGTDQFKGHIDIQKFRMKVYCVISRLFPIVTCSIFSPPANFTLMARKTAKISSGISAEKTLI